MKIQGKTIEFDSDGWKVTELSDGRLEVEHNTSGETYHFSDAGELQATSLTAGSLNTDDITVTNDPHVKGESDNIREEHGFVSHGSLNAAADGTWETFDSDVTAVSFSTAFAASPVINTTEQNLVWGKSEVANPSTTGFDAVLRNYSTSSRASGQTTHWKAIGGE